MQVYNTADLLQSLSKDVLTLKSQLQKLRLIPHQVMLTQPALGSWSIAQVLEHLNSYNRYYLQQIEKAMATKSQPNSVFKPGWLGNYFTNMMKPESSSKVGKTYTAPKDHTPVSNLNAEQVLSEIEAGMETLLKLLQKAGHADIAHLRVPISISKFIKLKLGDTFRFLIAHQQRHFVQVANTVATLTEAGVIINETIAAPSLVAQVS